MEWLGPLLHKAAASSNETASLSLPDHHGCNEPAFVLECRGIPFQPLPPVERRILSVKGFEQSQQTPGKPWVLSVGCSHCICTCAELLILPCANMNLPWWQECLAAAELWCRCPAAKNAKVGGEFVRPDSKLREAITADGSSGLKAEASRFHLYIANNCPWQALQLTKPKLKLECRCNEPQNRVTSSGIHCLCPRVHSWRQRGKRQSDKRHQLQVPPGGADACDPGP